MYLIPSFTFEGFQLGPVYIYTWGLTTAIGVLIAIWMAKNRVITNQRAACHAGRQVGSGMSENKFWNLAIILVISVFLGARLSYILETWNYYATDPLAALRFWKGGFSFFGGAVGGILAGWLWAKGNKTDFLYLGWLFTPAWLFGLFFGRIGCFLIHDHLGKPTGLPWGIYLQGAYRHEPALYEATGVLLIWAGLYWWEKKSRHLAVESQQSKKLANGLTTYNLRLTTWLFPLSLLFYSLVRFFLDFLRADDLLYFGLTVAQWACLTLMIWAIFLIQKTSPRVKSARAG